MFHESGILGKKWLCGNQKNHILRTYTQNPNLKAPIAGVTPNL